MTNINAPVPADRRVGSVLGLAYGDAIGDPVEFSSYRSIMASGGAQLPSLFRVTDDTQMSLAVWDAIEAWDMPRTMGEVPASIGMLRLELAASFGAWRVDRDNNRAPGTTCMSALGNLSRMGLGQWTLATSAASAGCGSVMRAPWIGLSDKLTDEMVERVAMLQAVLTHGPAENAYCAAALAALTRALARDEVAPGGCAEWLADWADERSDFSYDESVLSSLWRVTKTSDAPREGHSSPESYRDEGLSHVREVAESARALAEELRVSPWDIDPCSVAGEGWRARECMAVAVGILDGFALDTDFVPGALAVGALAVGALAVEMLLRAAETNGDSDSIGAITGALVGAAFGADAFPAEWLTRVEARYQHELAVAAGLVPSAR